MLQVGDVVFSEPKWRGNRPWGFAVELWRLTALSGGNASCERENGSGQVLKREHPIYALVRVPKDASRTAQPEGRVLCRWVEADGDEQTVVTFASDVKQFLD